MRTTRGVLIGGTAASLILAGDVLARAEQKTGGEMVHCGGVNACKGKGWAEMSAAECQKKGGRVVEPKEADVVATLST